MPSRLERAIAGAIATSRTLRRCRTCLLPETDGNVQIFPDGECSACKAHEVSKGIDFAEKECHLVKCLETAKSRGEYDCLVPVSGGKDSTYQVRKILALGFRPLCIAILPALATGVGEKNLRNLKSLGVDLVEVAVQENLWRPLARQSFFRIGSFLWFEVFCIFFRSIREAEERGITLIFWGENPGAEDGYPLSGAGEPIVIGKWPRKVQGIDVFELALEAGVDPHAIDALLPRDFERVARTMKGYYLGDFVKWDRLGNAIVSQGVGFRGDLGAGDFSVLPYENLDNPFFAAQNFVRYLRTGAGNVCSVLSYLVRRNIVLRQDVLEWALAGDARYPDRYLGYSLRDVLEAVDLSDDEFANTCVRFSEVLQERGGTDSFLRRGLFHP